MKVAVTGGTGFLGRYILRQLKQSDHKIRAWKRSSSDLTGLDHLGIDWVEGGLGHADSFRPLVEGVQAVVHAALERPAQGSFRDSGSEDLVGFAETNLLGSLCLMETARKAGVERFLFISTCAVHEIILDDRPLDEKHPAWPSTHYGAHKAALESFVCSYGHGDGWDICSLRPCGIYGLAHPASQSKYFDLVGSVLAGETIQSAKGGKEVHAADVARAVELLLQVPGESIRGEAFNCCEGYVSDQQVARVAKEISGSKSEILMLNRGPKHQISNAKLCTLGFQFGGEQLLRDTVGQLINAHRMGSG